jgi:hypothetical protein
VQVEALEVPPSEPFTLPETAGTFATYSAAETRALLLAALQLTFHVRGEGDVGVGWWAGARGWWWLDLMGRREFGEKWGGVGGVVVEGV